MYEDWNSFYQNLKTSKVAAEDRPTCVDCVLQTRNTYTQQFAS